MISGLIWSPFTPDNDILASASHVRWQGGGALECPRCRSDLPEVAHFCHVCGHDQRSADLARRKSFAAKPDEPVASFALVSTIMPRGAGQRPQTYRIALTLALVVALIAAIFGAMPIAVLVAAFAVPIAYMVYIYDVNLWDDEPLLVTGLAFALTGVLAIGFTVLWTFLRGPVPFSSPTLGGEPADRPGDLGQPPRIRRPDGRTNLRGDQRRELRLLRHPGPALGPAHVRGAGVQSRTMGIAHFPRGLRQAPHHGHCHRDRMR